MLKNSLIVVPQPVGLIETDHPTEAQVSQEEIDFNTDALKQVQVEIEMLEAQVENDRERIEEFTRKIDASISDEVREIDELQRRILELSEQLSSSDDLEDQVLAERIEEEVEFDEPDSDTEQDVDDEELRLDAMDSEEASEEKRIQTTLRLVYIAIVAKTHPDKCGNTSKVDIYRRATDFKRNKNLNGLLGLYKRVYGHEFGKSTLMDRLTAARKRRQELSDELMRLRNLPVWQIYQVNLRYDYTRAVSAVRETLKAQIYGLRSIIEDIEHQRNN